MSSLLRAKKSEPIGNKFHIFIIVAICWAIWKIRGKACFDGKVVRHPFESLCYSTKHKGKGIMSTKQDPNNKTQVCAIMILGVYAKES